MIDHRTLEDRAAGLQRQVDAIYKLRDRDGNIPEAKRDELMRLMGEFHSLEQIAKEAKDAELAELRAIVRNGQPLSGAGAYPTAESREFLDYLRTGAPMNASLSTTDANGGYIVPEPIHAAIVEKIRLQDPIFGLAHKFDMSGGDATMMLPYKNAHGAVANATETGARSEQNAPTFTSPTLTAYDYYTDQRATQQVLDSVVDLEELLIGWIAEDIYESLGVHLATGDGNTKASGLFAATSTYTTKLSGSAGAIANTNFLTLYTSLPPKYRAGAVWLMSSATLATVMAMSHPAATNNEPLVQWVDGKPTILGKPVLECSSAPEIGAANYPVAFGDVSQGYAVGTHRRPGVLRDPFTVAPYVRFYGLARLGGCPWDSQTILLLKSNNA